MAIITENIISKQDIIDRFNLRVRDWVTSNTNWVAGTGVWNTNVEYVLYYSYDNYTGDWKGIYHTTQPSAPSQADLNLIIGARTNAGTIVQTLKNFMSLYADNHRIILRNTGNYAPSYYEGVARLDSSPYWLVQGIQADVENAATNNGITSQRVITASTINNFIESCRAIWTSRCIESGAIEEFYYSYCHSSCHSNITCYNSRGRR